MHFQGGSTQNHNENLTSTDGEPNSQEQWVLEDSFKDLDLVIDLSCAKHVEDLEEHKEIEDEGQVLRVSGQLEMSVHVFAVKALNSSIENESWTFNQAFIDFFVSKVISLHVSNLLFSTFNWIFQPIISLLFSISLEGFTIFYLRVSLSCLSSLSTIIFLEDES